MGRSYKKTPVCANSCAESDKSHKVASHRAERRAVRVALDVQAEPPHPRAYGNPWAAPKDGKHWLKRVLPKFMRK